MNVLETEMAQRLALQLATADLARAARDLVSASARVTAAAKAWDPDGSKEDPAVIALAGATGGLLAIAARTAPGIRALFLEAVEQSEPQPKPTEEQPR